MEKNKKVYMLFDSRARGGDVGGATVLTMVQSEDQVKSDSEMFQDQNAIWYEYEKEESDEGRDHLVNGKPRYDFDEYLTSEKERYEER